MSQKNEQLDLFPLPAPARPLTARERADIRRQHRNLAVGRAWARKIREDVFGEDFGTLARLAKIDSREVGDLYVDSDEWIRIRDAEWLENTVACGRIGDSADA
jgi:hypothetical protein